MSQTGRYAPSPTSDLHLGNLRTALVAWLMARSTGRNFRLRIEDLDTARVRAAGAVAHRQVADLAALGIEFDPPTVRQSDRLDAYLAALDGLRELTYECFCTRREIAEAASAPHHLAGLRPYPGTCRRLSARERSRRRSERPPALRVHAGDALITVTDRWLGNEQQRVDDFVLRRNDGVFAYHFAVVVDDAAMGIDQIIRGADLLPATGRQLWLAAQLGSEFTGEFGHIGLVVNNHGRRLAKRDGDLTLEQLRAAGWSPQRVLGLLGHSLNLCPAESETTAEQLLAVFDPGTVPTKDWVAPQ